MFMTLLQLKKGNIATVSKLSGGKSVIARMSDLGLREGKTIQLLRKAPFHGPLLVEDVNCGAKIMISRKIALSIEVHSEEAK
jgi:Fe2+ transport system protein FeoA